MGDEIVSALEGPLTAQALVPVEATVTTAGTRRVLRVLVDRDVSGLDAGDATSPVEPLSLDEVADATRVVGEVLDQDGLMGERPYTLEVSSPGVSRPLSGYAALRRNVGRLVALTLVDGTSTTGRLTAVAPDEVTVEVPAGKNPRKDPATRRTVRVADVRSGAVQVEFNRGSHPADTADTGDTAEDGEE